MGKIYGVHDAPIPKSGDPVAQILIPYMQLYILLSPTKFGTVTYLWYEHILGVDHTPNTGAYISAVFHMQAHRYDTVTKF